MRYTDRNPRYIAARYRNTSQPMTPRVIVQPSLETARKHLATLRLNLAQSDFNATIYAAKIEQIFAKYPELRGDTLCTQPSDNMTVLAASI